MEYVDDCRDSVAGIIISLNDMKINCLPAMSTGEGPSRVTPAHKKVRKEKSKKPLESEVVGAVVAPDPVAVPRKIRTKQMVIDAMKVKRAATQRMLNRRRNPFRGTTGANRAPLQGIL